MEQVPKAYIENYVRMLNLLSADMRKKLSNDLAKVDLSDVARAREVTIALMERYCGPYTDYASAIAAEFFDGLAQRQTDKTPGALAESGRIPDATAGAVRAIMQDVVDGKPREVWEGKLLDRADKELRNAADSCIAKNARRHAIGWARVPQGATTCRWCIMLASRGAVYGSEEKAAAGHANCDCRVVPDFGRGIEGYDPDLYLDMWKHPERYTEAQVAVKGRVLDGVRKHIEVDGSNKNGARGDTWSLKPDSRFLSIDDEDEFHVQIRERFGCEVSEGFKKMPLEVKRWLMADLDALCDDYPIARDGLSLIGVAGDMGSTAIMVEPVSPSGQYRMVFNKDFFTDIGEIERRYASSLQKGNQVRNSSWSSMAYHDGFHGVEIALCAERYRGSGPEFYPAWRSCEIAEEIIDEAYTEFAIKETALGKAVFKLNISAQAGKTDSEAIAEAARDVRINAHDAGPESITIVKAVRRRFDVRSSDRL